MRQMTRSLLLVNMVAAAMACATPLSASPPKALHGSVQVVGDSVKVTLTCQANAPADTVYTVKCRNIVSENGSTVTSFDVPIGQTGSVMIAHATVTIGGAVALHVESFGVNRSGALSTVSTPQNLSVTVADGAPAAPKAVGGTVKYCPGGVCGP